MERYLCYKILRKNVRYYFLLFLVLLAIYIVFTKTVYRKALHKRDRNTYASDDVVLPSENNLRHEYPIFCLSLCESREDDVKDLKKYNEMAYQIERQFNQATNLIKSAASLTLSPYINFIVFVDEYWLYGELLKRTEAWPDDIRRKLTFQRRGIWYPEERANFQGFFRACSTEKLFLIEQTKDLDAVVYLDTDIIFMRPPEELWKEFESFNSLQTVGLAPSLYTNSKYLELPIYGATGVNSGLWMMNLTRMGTFPGGWINRCLRAYDEYRPFLKLFDQDIANIIFFENPELLYEIGCQWNYRTRYCLKGAHLCEQSEELGVYLMHGCGLSFFLEKDLKWRKFYEAWNDYEVGHPLTELLSTLRRYLTEAKGTNHRGCNSVEDIDFIFTKGLETHIKNL